MQCTTSGCHANAPRPKRKEGGALFARRGCEVVWEAVERAALVSDAPHRAMLEREVRALEELPEAVLFRDLLAERNDPFSVREITERGAGGPAGGGCRRTAP